MTIYTLSDIERLMRQYLKEADSHGILLRLQFSTFLLWLKQQENTRASADVLQFDLREEERNVKP